MRIRSITLGLLLAGCSPRIASVEPGEWLSGGDTTNTLLLGSNAFLMPAQNLTAEHEQAFYSGNSFFNQAWVEAPASTESRDGLGPMFNARTCSGCHFKDGKAAPPEDGQGPFVGLLLRLSVPGANGPVPDAVYGGQLQDQANPGVLPEAIPRIEVDEQLGEYDDGETYALGVPSYVLENPAYGPFAADLQVSPRTAPHMVGLGLLEAIPEARLRELADPDDSDGDGVSGRLQLHELDGVMQVGRFGWKADAVDIAHQSAGAFAGDMGLTSRIAPSDDCTEGQPLCLAQPNGGEPEIEDHLLDLVVLYSRTVAVPVRRNADDPEILRGKFLFRKIGCTSCHVPSHQTGEAALPELAGQLIWPYTDLLLHDMGEGLSDQRPLGEASGREWKTPPLWGVGLVPQVNGHSRYLHDGRARSLEEAVLWHGGEASQSQQRFLGLDPEDRAALLEFIGDL